MPSFMHACTLQKYQSYIWSLLTSVAELVGQIQWVPFSCRRAPVPRGFQNWRSSGATHACKLHLCMQVARQTMKLYKQLQLKPDQRACMAGRWRSWCRRRTALDAPLSSAAAHLLVRLHTRYPKL